MSKLFFFTEFYHPVQNTTGYYLTKIVHVAARSVKTAVHVCCAVPSNNGELKIAPNLSVHRTKGATYDKRRLGQRLASHFLATWGLAVRAFRGIGRGDIAFAITNPPFLMICLALLKKLKSFTYVLLVYDVHPETTVAAGLARQGSLSYRLTEICFNWAYRTADEIIVIGRDMEEVMRKKARGVRRITHIPNWVDVEVVRPHAKEGNELIRSYDLQDRTVFLFAGNLGRVQGIRNLLRAIERTGSGSVAFLFVGDGAQQPLIEEFICEHPGKKVIHLGVLPMSAQESFLNACDVALVTLGEAMYGLGVPSKSYFSMAAGKPLLLVADEASEIGRVIQEERIGWIVPPNRPSALARTIDEIARMSDLDEIGCRARRVAEARFSERVVLARYAEYFRQLCQ
jgi:glycosyltransferase involved in cell wall biosynthesis